MIKHARSLIAAVLVSAALTAGAQEYERVLVPLQLGELSGAFGSQWVTHLAVSNIGDTPVDVQGYGSCQVPCTPAPIPPQATAYVTHLIRSEVPAAFLFVEPGRLSDLSFTLRTYDRSRLHQTWGATVPVVTREGLFSRRFGIGDIPVTSAFRSTLRIYDFDATTPAAVRVHVYEADPLHGGGPPGPEPPDAFLVTLTPAFVVPSEGGGVTRHPAYAAIPLWLVPELRGVERVRVVVEPLDASGDYWGFVSSTHNETQHVTVTGPR